MGYLNNSTITVDAILTKKGRELLARGRDEFKITQFAVADDEIDYTLWNPNHPLGTDYYGIVIENMPLVEASTDESNVMRHKLITLPKNTSRIPVISVSQTAIILTAPGQNSIITPTTVNFGLDANSTLGYTAILSNSEAAFLTVEQAAPYLSSGNVPTVPGYIGDSESAQTVTVVGMSFKLTAKQQLLEDKYATLTIVANETGGRVTVNVVVKKLELTTVPGASRVIP